MIFYKKLSRIITCILKQLLPTNNLVIFDTGISNVHQLQGKGREIGWEILQARSQKFAACFYAIILFWVVLKIKVGKIWKLHENTFPMSTKTLWLYPEMTEKIAIQYKKPSSKIVKIFNRTGLVILVIGLLNSDAIFPVISGWNQEVIVYYGKLFSCSFQISPYFYF